MTSRLLLAAVVLAAAAGASAQGNGTAPRNIVPEAAPAFPAFQIWAQSVVTPVLPVVQAPPAAPLPWAVVPQAAGQAYQPSPLILGLPDLPLLRPAAGGAAQWAPQFNYQGMRVTLVVLDASGRQRTVRGIDSPPRPGERFKLRVTPTFDAVADIDFVLGDPREPWNRQRAGQAYPQAGYSVQIRGGETADLPLGPAEYFVMPNAPAQALVLSVRHPMAVRDARNTQPAYRQDGSFGSDYLQLQVERRFAAIEQLITAGR